MTTASSTTALGSIGDAAVAYKPLWDFPCDYLAHREVAAYLMPELSG